MGKTVLYLTFILTLFIKAFSESLTFGLTAVTIKDDFFTMKRWADYLKRKTGYDIKLVFTKNYDEMQFKIETGDIDFGYICGATYVFLKMDNADVEILSVPYFEGSPTYYSYIIVPEDSKAKSILDLKGKRFAFSDPKSNSGSIAPSYYLYKKGFYYKNFFKEIIYTYSHAESIEAVAEGFVDGASVDSLVFEYMKKINPDLISKVKIIEKLGPYPTTPIVINSNIPDRIKYKLRKALSDMNKDAEGRLILSRLGVDKFDLPAKIDYSPIRKMIETLLKLDRIYMKK